MRVLFIFTKIDRGECHMVLGLHRHGIAVTVVCQEDAQLREPLAAAGIPVRLLRFRSRRDGRSIRELRRIIAAESPDIVHVFTKLALSNALVALKGHRARLVAYRGIVGNISYLDPTSWLSFLHPRVDAHICVAEAVRRYLLSVRLFGLRIPPEKVVTIHKGHELDWYRQERRPDLASLGIPAGAPVIGCVARMRPRKGVPVLIEAFSRLPATLGAHLVLIGAIEDWRIPRAIARSAVRNRIHCLGYRSDAAALAGAFDVFVLPTLRREGLPRAVIESMAQGVAVVVTAAGGSPELIEDGVSGRVIKPGHAAELTQALLELLSDDERRQRYGSAAQERIATRFNVELTVQKTLAVYRRLLGRAEVSA